jgi:hypothetical protein
MLGVSRKHSMIRKVYIGVIFLLAASAVELLVFAYPYDWILDKRIHAVGVQNIIQVADKLDQIQNLPNEIKSLKPVYVLIEDEGVYIQLDGFFVTAEGIFVLRKSSNFNTKGRGDPSFRQIEGRLYWFNVTG